MSHSRVPTASKVEPEGLDYRIPEGATRQLDVGLLISLEWLRDMPRGDGIASRAPLELLRWDDHRCEPSERPKARTVSDTTREHTATEPAGRLLCRPPLS